MISSFAVPNSTFNRRYNTREYSTSLSPSGFVRSLLPEMFVKDGSARSAKPRAGKPWEKRFAGVFERLHRSLLSIISLVFHHPAWLFALLGSWMFSLVRLWQTGFRHGGAFILFLLTSSALIYGFQVAVLALPILRYTYCLEFVYYLAPFLLPIAWGRETRP